MRLLVVAGLVVAVVLAGRLLARRRRRDAAHPGPLPRFPSSLLGPSERTWVVFTTPYCASCGTVVDQLRAFDPEAAVVTVDAARQADLARAYSVRTSPTVLLADASGQVHRRLVGAAAVLELAGSRAGQVRRPA